MILIPVNQNPPISFTSKLMLSGAALKQAEDGNYELWLKWQTTGPIRRAGGPIGWRLQRPPVISAAMDGR